MSDICSEIVGTLKSNFIIALQSYRRRHLGDEIKFSDVSILFYGFCSTSKYSSVGYLRSFPFTSRPCLNRAVVILFLNQIKINYVFSRFLEKVALKT